MPGKERTERMKQLNLQRTDLRMTAGESSQFPQDTRPQIAFSGRSNVGKSSLLNGLIGRKKLARVSGEPGKTITVNFYDVDEKLYLVDLPGYGYARRSAAEKAKWSALVESYFQENPYLKLVLQLIDLKVGPTEDDDMMLDWLYQTGTPYIVIATKSDKLNKTEQSRQLEYLRSYEMTLPETPVIPYSALKGTDKGREEIWHHIYRASGL